MELEWAEGERAMVESVPGSRCPTGRPGLDQCCSAPRWPQLDSRDKSPCRPNYSNNTLLEMADLEVELEMEMEALALGREGLASG